ncbi:MAG: hypothetical protein JWO94_2860 [Verrucomicrobiaceae bacterium]|nr:hypothetical protein [Verrucomicrobiaceae bacterium]
MLYGTTTIKSDEPEGSVLDGKPPGTHGGASRASRLLTVKIVCDFQSRSSNRPHLPMTKFSMIKTSRLTSILSAGSLFLAFTPLCHAATVPLGEAGNFAVLGYSTVTNTGHTSLFGDLGVSPGTAVTGFLPGTFTGALHSADSVSLQARADAISAYSQLAALPVTHDLTGQDLGGLTLTPGVYEFSSSAQLTGTLTLDGQGQLDPLFVFQIGSTITTASYSSIFTTNGADWSNVYFQVGSSATLGTYSEFQGNIIALASDTLTTGVTVNGSVIALNGAVTLDTNVVVAQSNAPVTVVPEPGSAVLLALGFTCLRLRRKRPQIRG